MEIDSRGSAAQLPTQYTSFQDLDCPFQISSVKRCSRSTPIVIDNGSFELRAGFADFDQPSVQFQNRVFPSRFRADKTSNPEGNYDRVADQISADDWAKDKYLRSAFESNLVCNFSYLETSLDYSFSKLGIGSDSALEHPVIMTEPLLNPSYCRSNMYELLFETYQVPKTAFGVDSLFAYSYNAAQPDQRLNPDIGLVVSCSHDVSHIIPIYDGSPRLSASFRMSYGGFHLLDHLYRSICLQLPFESHAAVFGARCQEIMQRFCYVSPEFQKELDMYIGREDPSVVLTFPPDLSHSLQKAILTEDEKRHRDERIHAQTEKLKELARERREAMFQNQQESLEHYRKLKQDREANLITNAAFMKELKEIGCDDEEDFEKMVGSLQKKVENQLMKRGIIDASGRDEKGEEDLLDVPDEQLTEDQKKRKRVQRMVKGSAEARQKKKEEKMRREQQQADEHAALSASYAANPTEFVSKIRNSVEAAKKRRHERAAVNPSGTSAATASGRRTAAANRQRAAVITDMGTGTMDGSNFGADDKDWEVYRAVANSEAANQQDRESDREDAEEIKRLENILVEFAPDQAPVVPESVSAPREIRPKISLGVHRIRAPEILFQPSIAGIDQAGIAEAIQLALHRVTADEAVRMCQNIFVCGGTSSIPGFVDRLLAEMICSRSLGDEVRVVKALDPSLDAWRGAAAWGRSTPVYVDRLEYEEFGAEYIKEHRYGNVYVHARQPQPGSPNSNATLGTKRSRS